MYVRMYPDLLSASSTRDLGTRLDQILLLEAPLQALKATLKTDLVSSTPIYQFIFGKKVIHCRKK